MSCSLYIEPGIVTQARGSAYVEIGQTKVIAACYGPSPTERRQGFSESCLLECDVAVCPFAEETRRTEKRTDADNELAASLCTALSPCICLSKYPKSIITLYVNIVEDEGSVFACLVNACCVALVNAGVEMFDLVSACSICTLPSSDVVQSPTKDQENEAVASLTVASMASFGEVAFYEQKGHLSKSDTKKLLQQAVDECGHVHMLQRQYLMEDASRHADVKLTHPPSQNKDMDVSE